MFNINEILRVILYYNFKINDFAFYDRDNLCKY